MPLVDDAFQRGKCGLKLLQYMAAGLPAVASPVGVNAEIVIQGETGFLARREEDWGAALEELVRSADLRRSMGAGGRHRCEERLLDPALAAGADHDPESRRLEPSGEGEPGRMSPAEMVRLPGWRRAAKLEKRLPDCVLLVPTFKRPREMTVLLETLATLPDPPGRVLVVDGSGDDATDDAVAAWSSGKNLPFDLALVRSPAGLTRQRNVGVDASQEEFLYFLDDDCLPEPGYFSAIRRVFEVDRARTVGAVCGSLLNEMGRPLSRRWQLRFRLGLVPGDGDTGEVLPDGHVRSPEPRRPFFRCSRSGPRSGRRRGLAPRGLHGRSFLALLRRLCAG